MPANTQHQFARHWDRADAWSRRNRRHGRILKVSLSPNASSTLPSNVFPPILNVSCSITMLSYPWAFLLVPLIY